MDWKLHGGGRYGYRGSRTARRDAMTSTYIGLHPCVIRNAEELHSVLVRGKRLEWTRTPMDEDEREKLRATLIAALARFA